MTTRRGPALHIAGLVVLSAILISCASDRNQEAERNAEIKRASEAEMDRCAARYFPVTRANAIAWADCKIAATEMLRPIARYPDLISLMIATYRRSVERFARGEITMAQVQEDVARVTSAATSEEQRRRLAEINTILAGEAVSAAERQAGAAERAARPVIQPAPDPKPFVMQPIGR